MNFYFEIARLRAARLLWSERLEPVGPKDPPDPAEMVVDLSLIHVLREFGIGRSLLLPLLRRGGRIAPPPAVSFGAGMATLPTALGNALGERVHLRTRAIDLVRTGTGWRVRADRAGRAVEIEARQVVLAVPAPAAARLLEGESPGLSSRIARLRYNPLGVVHLEADTPLEGLGFQVSFTERNRALRGVTFNHSLFGRERLYTAYLGGALRPDVRDWSTDRLGREAVREFRETTGYESRVLSAEHESVPAWDITWRGLRAETIPPGLWLAGNWWSRPGIPGRLAEAERIAAGVVADASGMERGR